MAQATDSLKDWSNKGTGTNAGVSVTQTDPGDGRRHVVTMISGSGDAAALVTVESPANTILWRKRFAAAFTFSEVFPPGALKGAASEAVVLKISASTSNCEANISGYEAQA